MVADRQDPERRTPGDAGIVVAGSPTIVDTTELRWFFDGRPGSGVVSWFTRDGTTGFTEERCDTYLMNGRSDIGVKRRFRETLELKVRRSVGDRLRLHEGPSGVLEEWRRWSPADDRYEGSLDAPWLDVQKTVVKRRFSGKGREIILSDGPRTMSGSGCDVEITSVVVSGINVWTFAFASFGPPSGRRASIGSAWRALVDASPRPEALVARSGRASGYPEWLLQKFDDRPVDV